jgi:hypothetical protein
MEIPEDANMKAPSGYPYPFGAFFNLVFNNKSPLDKEKSQVKSKKKEGIICYQKEILLFVELLFFCSFSLQL